MLISKISNEPLYYSVLFLSIGNGMYQSIRSGNLSSFAFLFLVLSCYSVFKEKYFVSGIFYSIYCLYRITPIIVIIFVIFFIADPKTRKFLLGFSSVFATSILFSVLFQTILLRDWVLRVLIPESISNKFNETLSAGRQVLSNKIFGDYFDIPSVINFIHFISKSSLVLAIICSVFFVYSSYKLFLYIDKSNFNLETLIVLNILHLVFTPYFRSYHIIELSFIITIWLSTTRKEFPIEYWVFPISLYIGTYIKFLEGDTFYVILFNDLSAPLLLFFLFSQLLYEDLKKKNQVS
jgi:hypothetical protein